MRKSAMAICLVLVGLSVSLGAAVAVNIESLGPGVYVVKGDEPLKLTPSSVKETGQKKSNAYGFSASFKGKKKMTSKIEGDRAGVRLSTGNASFYFRGVDANGLVLIRLDSGKKEREFTSSTSTVGLRNFRSMGAEKMVGGVPEDETKPFSINQVDQMTQEVMVNGLEKGEYAFYDGARLYDFGVDTTIMASTR